MELSKLATKQFWIDYAATGFVPTLFAAPYFLLLLTCPPKLHEVLVNPWKTTNTTSLALRLFTRNMVLFVSTYVPAFLLFQYVRRYRRDLKYNPKTPSNKFILSEAMQSTSGIGVATAFQVLIGIVKGVTKGGAQINPLNSAHPLLPAFVPRYLPLIMLWGDLHFYVTHRLIHSGFLYKEYHSLHHKSHNPNPFSGLSMHTVEHIIYFTAMLPCLAAGVSLEACDMMGGGLILGPLPAHIGVWPFETHHWNHHAEFNFNYGNSEMFDILFGTTYEAYHKRKLQNKETAEDKARQLEAQRQRTLCDLKSEHY
jgi:sterol desaturase/sphingolipid hydroxylase (fatty acid hydroxylase superfamily)